MLKKEFLLIAFVFLGCSVEFNASSISDKTLVNFSIFVSGSNESGLLVVELLNRSDAFAFK